MYLCFHAGAQSPSVGLHSCGKDREVRIPSHIYKFFCNLLCTFIPDKSPRYFKRTQDRSLNSLRLLKRSVRLQNECLNYELLNFYILIGLADRCGSGRSRVFELHGTGLSRGQRSERTAVGSSPFGEYLFCECVYLFIY